MLSIHLEHFQRTIHSKARGCDGLGVLVHVEGTSNEADRVRQLLHSVRNGDKFATRSSLSLTGGTTNQDKLLITHLRRARTCSSYSSSTWVRSEGRARSMMALAISSAYSASSVDSLRFFCIVCRVIQQSSQVRAVHAKHGKTKLLAHLDTFDDLQSGICSSLKRRHCAPDFANDL